MLATTITLRGILQGPRLELACHVERPLARDRLARPPHHHRHDRGSGRWFLCSLVAGQGGPGLLCQKPEAPSLRFFTALPVLIEHAKIIESISNMHIRKYVYIYLCIYICVYVYTWCISY